MQISDVNNNLLAAMTGQNIQKTEVDSESNRFADLLVLPEDKIQKPAFETASFQDKSQKFIAEKNTTEVKAFDNIERKYADPEQVKTQSTEKTVENKVENKQVDDKQTKEKSDATEKESSINKEASENATNEVSYGQNSEKVESGKEGTEVDGVAFLMAAVPEANVVLADDERIIIENTEALPVVSEDGLLMSDAGDALVTAPQTEQISENLTVPVTENNEAISAEDIQPVADKIEENIVQTNLNDSEVVLTQQKIASDEPSVNIEKDLVNQQEEKIAEILPEDKKVEIKVSVSEDKVIAKPQQNISENVIVAQDIELQDVKNEADISDGVLLGQAKSEQEISKPTVIAAPVTEVQTNTQNQTVSDKGVVQVIDVENVVQTSAVVQAVNDSKISAMVTENDNVNDIYNKGLTREVAEQIKVNITQSAIKGIDKIEIQLKPAELGQVDIKLNIDKTGKIQAQIIASNADTLALLENDTDILKEAFNNAGYQAEDESFSFSHRGGQETENEQEKLRTFIGEVIEKDVAEEMAANDYISADGVNIRV
ncbi:MAG: flagellar hook-length control protein FliK [Alphaproteobacteria bacterium]|nr:flagellar hook-length control protein FliK [Alphaproteobacteria bacterium]